MGGYTYRTKQGDMWDYIAWTVYGDESYVSVLYRANPQYLDIYLFEDGACIYCPEVAAEAEEEEDIPEWRDSENLEEDFYDDSEEEENPDEY